MLQQTDTFTVFIPETSFGYGAVNNLGNLVKRFGCKKPLIVTDNSIIKAGLLPPVEKPLQEQQMTVGVFDGCQPDAPFSVIDACSAFIKEGQYDLLVGLGGGSIMDTTKVAAVAATQKGEITSYVGVDKVKKPGLPKIFIPTTAGTAAEWSWAAVVTDDRQADKHEKMAIISTYLRADAVIVDANMTLNLPPRITAETGIDTLAHGIEPFTSIRSSIMSDMVSGACIKLVAQNLRAAVGQGSKNPQARYNMAIAASLGFGFTISSGGCVHGMAYPLQMSDHKLISHAVSIAILLPNIMEFNMVADLPKFAQIAALMGEDVAGLPLKQQAQRSVAAVRELIADVGLPSRMRDVNVQKSDIPGYVDAVFKNSPHLVAGNSRLMTPQQMAAVFEAAW